MCGITGFIKLDQDNKQNVLYENLAASFEEASKRGIGAAGFYSPITGVIKDGLHPTEFIKKYKKKADLALKSPMLIGHARAASREPAAEAPYTHNGNNHPHESKNYVLIHNGFFAFLPKVKGYPYRGACDSELALSYIETFGVEDALEMFSRDDKFALVIIHKPTQNVYFYRNDNPIVYSFDEPTGSLLFGSTIDTVLGLSTTFDKHGLYMCGCLTPVNVKENHLMTVTPDGNVKFAKNPIIHPRHAMGIRNLPKAVQDKLEVEDFFASSLRFVGGSRKLLNAYDTSMDTGRRSMISQTKTSNLSLTTIGMTSLFTSVKNGVLMFHAPLKYVNDSTNLA